MRFPMVARRERPSKLGHGPIIWVLPLLASFMAGIFLASYFTPKSHAAPALDAVRSQAAAAMLRHCQSLECLRDVHDLSSPQSRFSYPHFMIIGWRKSATTSLYKHLVKHPQVRGPSTKEPHYFTGLCRRSPWRCPVENNKEPFYVQTVLGTKRASNASFSKAMFEASADYIEDGATAGAVRAALPWVRVVASMREPISRAISWQNSLASRSETQHLACLREEGADLSSCLLRYFKGGQKNYSHPLSKWIEAFPREQLFIIQYENLTGRGEGAILRELHSFLGLDDAATAPEGGEEADVGQLGNPNNRKKDHPEGWLLTREQYQQLIEVVRPDVHRVGELLTEKGLGDGPAWVAAWEAAWEANLASNCDAEGQCHIQVT